MREGRLWVPRVVSNRDQHPRVPAGEDPPYRLFLDNAGADRRPQNEDHDPPPLAPHAVEIDVAASALNFRDVMVTLGLLPALAYERSALGREVGMEASGVVRRAGVAVEGLEPGDEVVFVDGGCIANRTVVGQHRVFPKPAGLSMEEAASSLSVYVTAYYSLIHLARLRKGQRVLIHSAMGGIGQAAIALREQRGRRDLRHGGQREQTRPAAGAGRPGGLRFPQRGLVRRADEGDRRPGRRCRAELARRPPRRALPAGAEGGWLALRDRQGRHLCRQRPRPPRLPQEPALRGHRPRPPDGGRPAALARALPGLSRPARSRRGAAVTGHRLLLWRLREGAPPDDLRPAPGEAGAEGAAGFATSGLPDR